MCIAGLLRKALPMCILLLVTTIVRSQSISGVIRDGNSDQALIGASVNIKGTTVGAVTDLQGDFKIDYSGAFPIALVARYLGYEEKEIVVTQINQKVTIEMIKNGVTLSKVTITDSRLTDKQRESPLTVEAMDYIAIKQTPAFNFYEGLGQLKGVDLTSASLGFKIINTRGFNSTSPVRSLQLIDGVDNQSPGLNFSLGNFLGAPDMDVVKVDLVVGASSAYYGPNAFNGVISMTTKDPFLTPGLMLTVKGGERDLLETGLRYAHYFNNKRGIPKFAFKINGFYMRAHDWEATNTKPTEQSPDAATNPGGYDAVNRYGDEYNTVMDYTTRANVWQYPGLNTFYRPGYREKDLVDYNTRNGKASLSMHYRLTDSLEMIAASNFGTGTTVYQGDNRFSLKNILFLQNRLEIRRKNKFFIRVYATNENSGKSYDAYFTALLMQQTAKSDVDWATDYASYWKKYIVPRVNTLNGYPTFPVGVLPVPQNYTDSILMVINLYSDSIASWHGETQAYANNNSLFPGQHAYYQPGTPQFDSAFNYITTHRSFKEHGTMFYDRSSLYHAQGEYIFHTAIADITLGGNGRLYRPDSRGTIFSDTSDDKIKNYEYGFYTGFDKKLNNGLRFDATVRMDKNQNFPFAFSPAASIVYTYRKHTWRSSFSSAIRNPTLTDQYLYYNVGRAILLGNLNGFDSVVTVQSLLDFIETKNPDTLSYFNVAPVVQEKVKTIELGYRASLLNHLYLDAGGYYSLYTDFIGYKLGVDLKYNKLYNVPEEATVYRVAANADDLVTTYGASIGLQYFFKQHYSLGGNYSLNVLQKKENQDPIIPAYNTPKHKFNLSVSGRDIAGKLLGMKLNEFGFNVNYKWVQGFTFEGSPQFTGFIPTYDMVDAQVNKRFSKINTTFKLGCSNLFGLMPAWKKNIDDARVFNNRHLEAYGGPYVGRLAYFSLTYELSGNKLEGQ